MSKAPPRKPPDDAETMGPGGKNYMTPHGFRRFQDELRQIDRRIRFLTKRLESAEVVDPARQRHLDRVFFGATVSYADDSGAERTITIVGIDEADMANGQ